MRIFFKYQMIFSVRFASALLLVVLVNGALAQVPKGEVRATVAQDIAPKEKNSDYYNEFWSYRFFLNDDIQLVLNYSRANVGNLKDPVCGADLSIANFKGKNYMVAREYPKAKFIYNPANGQLNVHEKIWFDGLLPGAHHVRFETEKEGVAYYLDLTFSAISPSLVQGNGEYMAGGETVGMILQIPYAKVSGVLAINGDTIAVQGNAIMDHTWQTNTGPSLVKRGIRYMRYMDGGIETAYFLHPKEGSVPVFGYALRRINGQSELLQPTGWAVTDQGKKSGIKDWIKGLEITFNNNNNKKTNIQFKAYYQKWEMLSEFSGVTKWTVKKFMGGEFVFFRGWAVAEGKSGFYDNFYVR
jgi:hypothetical protein